MRFLPSIFEAPELRALSDHERARVVESLFERCRHVGSDRVTERWFVAALCVAVFGGVTVGYLYAREWGALGAMAVAVFATCIAFARLWHSIWRRRLREFMQTDEYHTLLRRIDAA